MDLLNDTKNTQNVIDAADQAAAAAELAYEAAIDHLQQVLDRWGEVSDQYRDADEFCQAAHNLRERTTNDAEKLRKARPTAIAQPDNEAATIRVYDGTQLSGMFIADGTNPWIEVAGEALTWPHDALPVAQDNDCDQCAGEPLPGVLTGMDDDAGIQRCDSCERYAGDLDAAHALARLVGGVVKFEQDPSEPQ